MHERNATIPDQNCCQHSPEPTLDVSPEHARFPPVPLLPSHVSLKLQRDWKVLSRGVKRGEDALQKQSPSHLGGKVGVGGAVPEGLQLMEEGSRIPNTTQYPATCSEPSRETGIAMQSKLHPQASPLVKIQR
ncbi:progesterone receptor [Platysternon megacephalum]|uniref:Progesterone receptor n=1 Tax=Platysternon megacephalum TaxID=55544 RepID=A0A4D9E996_9SAUR|nr:progesterone receptor [Platysternon megacephalum]